MEIDEVEARLIARAMILVNKQLSGELERIMGSDESEYLKEAAVQQYNLDIKGFTQLHLRLAEAFPVLTQR